MRTMSLVLLLMVVFVLMGCSDKSSPFVSPTNQAINLPSSNMSLAKGGIINSVTGSAHWRYVPITGQTNVTFAFSAIRHADGSVTGKVETRDKGPIMYGKASVYDLKVEGNMAKLSFRFTSGNLNTTYPPPADYKITDIYGWVVVIDNGEGAKANGPDLVSLIVFTNPNSSDIQPLTIALLDPMGPTEYLQTMGDWLLANYELPYEMFLTAFDNGSVQVR